MIFKKKNRKDFVSVNQENSTLGKQCIAKGKCRFRFTTMCDTCKNNIGAEEEKSYYEQR